MLGMSLRVGELLESVAWGYHPEREKDKADLWGPGDSIQRFMCQSDVP